MKQDIVWQTVYGNLKSVCRVSRALRKKIMTGFFIEVSELSTEEGDRLISSPNLEKKKMCKELECGQPVYRVCLMGPSRKRSNV
jgi:hypothetical protein